MTELAFIYLLSDSFAPGGRKNGNPVFYKAHGYCMAVRTFRIFRLIYPIGESFYGAALIAFPYIIIHRIEPLLQVLRIIQELIILLLPETPHLRSACRAFYSASPRAPVDDQRQQEEYKSGSG